MHLKIKKHIICGELYAVTYFKRDADFRSKIMKKKVDKSEKLEIRLKSIAQKLKKIREDKGFTSAETFANEKEINRVQYWRMEKGNNITIKSLINVLDKHKMTLSEFFSDIQ